VDDFPPAEFWTSLPGTIPIHAKKETHLASLEEVLQLPLIATVMESGRFERRFSTQANAQALPEPIWEEGTPAVFVEELEALSKAHRAALFQQRSVESTRWLPSEHLVIYWKKGDEIESLGGPPYRPSRLVAMTNAFTIGFQIHALSDATILVSDLFNKSNPLVNWALRVKKASEEGQHGLTTDHFEHLYELLHESCDILHKVDDLARYVEKWRAMRGLPDDLYPPTIKLLPQMFFRFPLQQKLENQSPEESK